MLEEIPKNRIPKQGKINLRYDQIGFSTIFAAFFMSIFVYIFNKHKKSNPCY